MEELMQENEEIAAIDGEKTEGVNDATIVKADRKNAKFGKIKGFFDRNWLYFAAPLLICALFFSVLYLYDIYPFSHTCMSNYDLLAQICPFFEHFYDVLDGKSSLFYSTAIIGGADVFGTLAYCAVSPFTFLFLLFGKGNVYYAVSFVMPIKLSVIAASAIYFFKKKFVNVPDHFVLTVSILYAFCGYMFVANTYINWMDFLIYMPFVILGFEKLVKEGRIRYFAIAYALMIYTCFSISCFAMLIVFMIFVAYVLIMGEKGKRFELLARMCIALGISVALALPIMVPSLKAYLQSGRNTGLFENMGKDLEVNHLYRKTSYILSDALFSMMIVFYFIKSRFKKKVDFFYLVALIFMLAPVFIDEVCNLLNFGSYMSYAYRFGFLNAAFSLYMTGLVLNDLKPVKIRSKLWSVISAVIFFLLSAGAVTYFILYNKEVVSEKLFDFSSKFAHSLGGLEVISQFFGIIAGLLIVAFVFYKTRIGSLKVMSFMLIAVFAVQVACYNIHLVTGNKFNPVRYDQYRELFTSGMYDDVYADALERYFGSTVSVKSGDEELDGKSFSHCLRLDASVNGSYSFNTGGGSRYIELDIADECRLIVYARSVLGNKDTKLQLYSSAEDFASQPESGRITQTVSRDGIEKKTFSVGGGGKYYLVADGTGSVDIYSIAVSGGQKVMGKFSDGDEILFTEEKTFTERTALIGGVYVNAGVSDNPLVLDHYRIKDYDAAITNDSPFSNHTESYSVFSSVIDRANLAATKFFSYGGNNINSIESKGGIFFGDALLGYKYYYLHNDRKTHENSEKRSYNVRLENAQRSYFATGVNTLVFPNAYYVKGGDLDFTDDFYYNMEKLYTFLGGEGQLFDDYPITKNNVSYNESTGVYTVKVTVKDEGHWFMKASFPEEYGIIFSSTSSEPGKMKSINDNTVNFNYSVKSNGTYSCHLKSGNDTPLTKELIAEYCVGACLPLSKIEKLRDLLYTRAASYEIVGGDLFRVNVTADGDDCYLFMNYVAIEGFEATVNGKKAQLKQNGLNFMLVKLDDGENLVEIKYHSPYVWHAIVGLFAGAAIIAAVWLIMKKWRTVYNKAVVPVVCSVAALLAVGVFGFFFAYPSALFTVKLVKLLWGLVF